MVELKGFLTGRWDEQFAEVGTRFPASLRRDGQLPDDHEGDERATRRQATGTTQ
ncbi:hypothetical protein [Streptomyces sp. SAS_267]|uniref:hypothetical protein n=1 Tax=Streptomyces sp. SAS_267 TaxID=3412750 RepID=UPI00403C853E